MYVYMCLQCSVVRGGDKIGKAEAYQRLYTQQASPKALDASAGVMTCAGRAPPCIHIPPRGLSISASLQPPLSVCLGAEKVGIAKLLAAGP